MTRNDKVLLSVFAATGIAFACVAALTGERPDHNESAFSEDVNCTTAPLHLAAMQLRADAPPPGGMGGAPVMPFGAADPHQKTDALQLSSFDPACM